MTQTLTIPSVQYSPSYCGSYIELTVTKNGVSQNNYSIENAQERFENWCVQNGHGLPSSDFEFDPDEGTCVLVSDVDVSHCKEDNELLIDYCLEQIKRDFKI